MGRAGAGGGGHRSSGGGHSSARSSGGHRVSSSGGSHSRAGSSSRGSYSYRGSTPPPMHTGPGMPPPPRRYGYYGRRHYGYGGYGGYGYSRFSVTILVVLIVLGLMIALSGAFKGTSQQYSYNNSKSTIVRERIDTNTAYMNDCIIDELGWFNNTSRTASRLKEFWEKTGVQPYIILRAYDPALTTDAQKEQWATEYYDENFDAENIFLFVYFAEKDTDNDVGYMAYANGYQTSSVMDSEAIEIFWSYIDRYWYTNAETDDVFINAFNNTADVIMHVSTTGMDILKWMLILCVVVVVGVVLVTVIKQRNKRAKEKAEEEAKILNTPIDTMVSDNLEDKYLK
ncbi:MAG: hypothetical protein HDR19_06115 [Lachnospiraceae bacterium]|nr:hypothetical protein [Lachnospiraceae bacterium]